MSEIRLGIAGLGTVAQGLLALLKRNGDLIAARSGMTFRVTRVASRRSKPEVDLLGATFGTDLAVLARADDVDVVVELIGGEDSAKQLIEDAMAHGKPVVTANKAIIARFGNDLLRIGQAVRYEAAVAGAIPIIQSVRESLVANRVTEIIGIINGTCNYILTAMEEQGASFADALAEAQALGYAEADPTFDVEGIDAAHKLTILAGLAFDCAFDFDGVMVEGITGVQKQDIQFAGELGYRIKHLGIAKTRNGEIELRAHPCLIPKSKLLAHVNDVANAVLVKSDAAGQTLYSGPGAGGEATASAVLADIVALGRELVSQTLPAPHALTRKPVVAVDAVKCAQYLRIAARDVPGVFAEIAKTLSNHGISIEAAIQKEPKTGQDVVPIVILTQVVAEADIEAAIAELSRLDQVMGAVTRIRVESLG